MDDENVKLDSQMKILSKHFSKLAFSLSKTTVSKVITFTAQISESKHTLSELGQNTLLQWTLKFVVIETYCTVINFTNDNQKQVQ